MVQNNLSIFSNDDGMYAVLVTDTHILTNTIQGGVGGALLISSVSAFHSNQVRFNAGDSVCLKLQYGLQRDPAAAADDIVGDLRIENDTFASNAGAGIHGLDAKADPFRDPVQLNTVATITASG